VLDGAMIEVVARTTAPKRRRRSGSGKLAVAGCCRSMERS
jgi:hypothetical protein